MNIINKLGLAALICGLGSFIPFLGTLLGLASGILILVLYYLLDKEHCNTNFFKISLWGIPALIVPAILIGYLIINNSISNNSLMLIGITIFILLIVLAILNFIQGQNILKIANQNDNPWLRISGGLTKVGAVTLPILFGALLLTVANILFLIGCITYKPKQWAYTTGENNSLPL